MKIHNLKNYNIKNVNINNNINKENKKLNENMTNTINYFKDLVNQSLKLNDIKDDIIKKQIKTVQYKFLKDIEENITNILELYKDKFKSEREKIKEIIYLMCIKLIQYNLKQDNINNRIDLNMFLKEIFNKKDIEKYFKGLDIENNKNKENIIKDRLDILKFKNKLKNINKNNIEEELLNIFPNKKYEIENLQYIKQKTEKMMDEYGEEGYLKILNKYVKKGGLIEQLNTEKCKVYLIKNKEASVAVSGYANWCTGYTGADNAFYNYRESGLRLFYFPKDVIEYTLRDGKNYRFGRRFGVISQEAGKYLRTVEEYEDNLDEEDLFDITFDSAFNEPDVNEAKLFKRILIKNVSKENIIQLISDQIDTLTDYKIESAKRSNEIEQAIKYKKGAKISLDGEILHDVNFEDVIFKDILKENKIKNAEFHQCHITDSSFEGIVLENCYFNDCKIKETNFGGCILNYCSFVEGSISQCHFEGSKFIESNLRETRINKCSGIENIPNIELVGDTDLDNKERGRIIKKKLSNYSHVFDATLIREIDFADYNFRGKDIRGYIFIDCDNIDESIVDSKGFNDAGFIGCRFKFKNNRKLFIKLVKRINNIEDNSNIVEAKDFNWTGIDLEGIDLSFIEKINISIRDAKNVNYSKLYYEKMDFNISDIKDKKKKLEIKLWGLREVEEIIKEGFDFKGDDFSGMDVDRCNFFYCKNINSSIIKAINVDECGLIEDNLDLSTFKTIKEKLWLLKNKYDKEINFDGDDFSGIDVEGINFKECININSSIIRARNIDKEKFSPESFDLDSFKTEEEFRWLVSTMLNKKEISKEEIEEYKEILGLD